MEATVELKGYKMLADFLQENEQTFLDDWEEQIVVNETEDDRDLIRNNGYLMYRLIISSIGNKVRDSELKSMAYRVAEERLDANINIGEFVYNVNLGRSIIIKQVYNSGICSGDVRKVIDLVNRQFDLFCYYAVTRYTDLKDIKLQEQNHYISQTHKERLAILGQMSSSFVHEFRNPLTSVMGFIRLLKSDYPNLPYLDVVSIELDQLKFRITQFLHTSKKNIISDDKNEEIPIRDLLVEVIDFLYPSIVDGNIQVNSHIDASTTVYGDRNELKQVFLNLLINAVDAVFEKDKQRIITIQTLLGKNEVKIMISNNGEPIREEIRKIIFEPFYTTKKLGTGIGLFVCKNIIEKHKGSIHCQSDEDLTSFEICLPITEIQ
ncbi:histidine kinase [Bacillus sp. FJAT-18017]|uniref:histidine kinase N-terminal domain-containing protein n=1 Tax=Bacillus sp. FJAT-18017 TaxID=1705566 RepID=UPI0006ADCC1E|nr:histidine kinase N-terminal domain-containing protein [Bacillus sp. FJAT-18017]ALC90543.1 histidine kinase [Bacillus sp. FJAT-18017]